MSVTNELRNFTKVVTLPAEKVDTGRPDKSDETPKDARKIKQDGIEQLLGSLVKANDKSQETLSSLGQETDIEMQESLIKEQATRVPEVKLYYESNILFIQESIRKYTDHKSFIFANPEEVGLFDWEMIQNEKIRKDIELYANAVLKEYRRSVSLYNKFTVKAKNIALANPQNEELQEAATRLVNSVRQFYLHFNDFKNLKELEKMLEGLNQQDTELVLTQAHTCVNFMGKLGEELKKLEQQYEWLMSQQEVISREIDSMSKSNAEINEMNRQVMYS